MRLTLTHAHSRPLLLCRWAHTKCILDTVVDVSFQFHYLFACRSVSDDENLLRCEYTTTSSRVASTQHTHSHTRSTHTTSLSGGQIAHFGQKTGTYFRRLDLLILSRILNFSTSFSVFSLYISLSMPCHAIAMPKHKRNEFIFLCLVRSTREYFFSFFRCLWLCHHGTALALFSILFSLHALMLRLKFLCAYKFYSLNR